MSWTLPWQRLKTASETLMDKLSVLLIEDSRAIATEIYDFLEQQGMTVDYAETGHDGLRLATRHAYDVIVLDVMLPDISGVTVCQHIKAQCDPIPPVLLLTARDSLSDKSDGFAAGADDYLTKPFEQVELALRCRALGRRQQLHGAQQRVIGELVVNDKQQWASRAGDVLPLSSTDFAILCALAQAYPNAVSRQQLINQVWGDDFPDSDVLRSHIYTLRQALDKPYATAMLKTIHGIGFRLEA
ncbi:response regulator transcription factor [Aestuariibacter halophilus]|uniref:Response regulator transcription factor n=1 Tax=Fluctibacter halophilus TaxID=226011 RepID=A0ABS8G7X1_9ALTE|nr:response regulator transcription factor [Aestuariibacter halophilus]MCC2616241.1 response regulator transcription factor [Aestuariibacter halophilus]